MEITTPQITMPTATRPLREFAKSQWILNHFQNVSHGCSRSPPYKLGLLDVCQAQILPPADLVQDPHTC